MNPTTLPAAEESAVAYSGGTALGQLAREADKVVESLRNVVSESGAVGVPVAAFSSAL